MPTPGFRAAYLKPSPGSCGKSNLTSTSRSGARFESTGNGWPPLQNFFTNDFLSLPHTLPTLLFFFTRGGTGGPQGEGGGRGGGSSCGRAEFWLALSPGPKIVDTIGDVCLSQVEISLLSELSSDCSGPMISSMSLRMSLNSELNSPTSRGTVSSKSTSATRGKPGFLHEDSSENTPVPLVS